MRAKKEHPRKVRRGLLVYSAIRPRPGHGHRDITTTVHPATTRPPPPRNRSEDLLKRFASMGQQATLKVGLSREAHCASIQSIGFETQLSGTLGSLDASGNGFAYKGVSVKRIEPYPHTHTHALACGNWWEDVLEHGKTSLERANSMLASKKLRNQ